MQDPAAAAAPAGRTRNWSNESDKGCVHSGSKRGIEHGSFLKHEKWPEVIWRVQGLYSEDVKRMCSVDKRE